MAIKKLSYYIGRRLYRKYHKHSKYWYYFYVQFCIFNATELLILFCISNWLNITLKTVLVLIGFFMIRSTNAKNHMDSYSKCIIVSTVNLIGLSIISNIYDAFFMGFLFGYLLDTRIGNSYLKFWNKILRSV